jgi:hypothetical protein
MQKPSMKLRAGMLEMIYENGNIRYITAGGNELLRMIYPAVRDKNWLTIIPSITSEEISRNAASFRISITCLYKCEDVSFRARYNFTGSDDSSIVLELEGEILEKTIKNRIGFCVLHPIEGCAGNACSITHSSGLTENLKFPENIIPDQAFADIKMMEWTGSGIKCTIEFSGDIFETEDQRNWCDASYKTYSTPLDLPFPVTLEKGHIIKQRIVLRAESTEQIPVSKSEKTVISFFPGILYPFPETGTGRSSRTEPIEDNELIQIRDINFDHYRSDIYLFSENWAETADKSVEEAKRLGYKNELVLFFDENYSEQAELFSKWLQKAEAIPALITILHKNEEVTPKYLADFVGLVLKKIKPDLNICSGTNCNFAELNRGNAALNDSLFVTFAIHPQEHASDNNTLVENLKAQQYSVESARKYFPEKKIRVSPVNIQRRFNANISTYEIPANGLSIPPQVDTRLMSLFGACWAAGSFKYLAESGADGITCFETVGERGLLQGNHASRWPEVFRTKPGMVFPVYHFFRWLLNDKSFHVMKSSSSSPLLVEVLTLVNDQKTRMALINYGHLFQSVSMECGIQEPSVYCLEAETFEAATKDPDWILNCKKTSVSDLSALTLSPFSVTFIEGSLNV